MRVEVANRMGGGVHRMKHLCLRMMGGSMDDSLFCSRLIGGGSADDAFVFVVDMEWHSQECVVVFTYDGAA